MFLFVVLFLVGASFCFALEEDNSSNGSMDSTEMASNAKSAIMIEASTGKILYEKNKDEKLPMASMTKMMTLLLIMEEIDAGRLKWDEMITTSEHAASMGGSQIFLEVGEKMSVEDLVKGICIASGNDASVAMAERIGGTEEKFVVLMNKTAEKLGLSNTHFENACGLDSDNHYSSANDMSVIARELVKHKKILEFSGIYEDYLRKNTEKSFWLVNTNKLVRYYQGVDGLKTGYTKKAGYCITTTAKRSNMRLITVVMGEPSSAVRNRETTEMLNYGFNTYEVSTLIDEKVKLKKQKVLLGKKDSVEIVPLSSVKILNSKSSEKRNVRYQLEMKKIKAPVKVGDEVGKVLLIEDGKVIEEIGVTVKENVEKLNLLMVYYQEFLGMMRGGV